jgi:anaerobic magnesium-protoporphyrin IX monomethyl ester cyclase
VISVLDLFPLTLSPNCAVERILSTNPHVIGISFITAQADITYELVGAIRAVKKDILLVAGGVHASVLPEEALSRGFDRVVVGEGERAFAQILLAARSGGLEQARRIVSAHYLEASAIPGCDWGEIGSWDQYNERTDLSGPSIPIMASRGCAFDCSFCASKAMWNQKIRWRLIDEVVEEIRNAKAKTGHSNFQFYDDDFLVNPRYAQALVSELKKVQPIQWVALTTVRSLLQYEDLLPTLRESGCQGFHIGIETADSTVLKRVKKRHRSEDSRHALMLLRKHGFPYIEPLVMLFNECERPQSVALEVDLFKEVGLAVPPIDDHQYATPFPGTSFYRTCRNTGMVFLEHWRDYRTARVNYIPNTFLDAKFPGEGLDLEHDITGELNWATALDRTDGAEIASNLWSFLTNIERSKILGLSVRDVSDFCFDLYPSAFKNIASKVDILRGVSLLAVVASRLSAQDLKSKRTRLNAKK